ncbi:HSP70 family [Trichoderma camerunense]
MPQPYQTQAATDGGKDQEPTIIIGIDFGTTYSGVAWTTSSRPGHINIITNWDASKSHCSDKEKVPSAIHYDDKGVVSWGYSVPEKASSLKFEWFKLCLLDESDIPDDIRNAAQIKASQTSLRESNKPVVDVISDYLRGLWKHSIRNIRRAIGGQLVDISRFKVVATIPAIWPPYAQMRMLEAIEKAGILESRTAGDTILEFLTEPEAAALATINDMCTYNQTNMKVGDQFIVCDAGGGTVDVITYTVTKTDPLRVQESVKGDGKLCGATFLDEVFQTTLRSKLDKISPDAWQILEESGALSRIIHNDWENGIKPQFRNTDQHWLLQMPTSGLNRKRTHDQFRFSDIKFDAKDVQNIFKPIVAEIEKLVTDQAESVKRKYKEEPKFLVLVGGFGRQPFLYTRLQDKLNLKESQKEKTEVLQGSGAEPWTAVCRGAVIRGLELSEDTTESTDTAIPVDKPVIKSFCQDLAKPTKTVQTNIIYSTASTPPARCDETVKRLCDVRWSTVPDFDSLPTWTNAIGQVIRRINFDVKMTSNGVTLDFEIVYKNQVMASKKIGMDYTRCGSTVN